MGALILPKNARVFLDASPIIYSVERIDFYDEIMQPLWQAAHAKQIELFGSDLLRLEVLTKPIQLADQKLIHDFQSVLAARELRLLPITPSILERAATLRAVNRLKTPDAIHIATAIEHDATLFVTNDKRLRNSPLPNVVVLADLL